MASNQDYQKKQSEEAYQRGLGRQGHSTGTTANAQGLNQYYAEKELKEREKRSMEQWKKTAQSGNTGKSGSCWVATAYYGHTNHPEVELMRAYRDQLLTNKIIGRSIEWVNTRYHRIGASSFGHNWARALSSRRLSYKKIISACALNIFRFIIKLTSRW